MAEFTVTGHQLGSVFGQSSGVHVARKVTLSDVAVGHPPELSDDVISMQLGSFGSTIVDLSVVSTRDWFAYSPAAENDVARCIDWQTLRTGGFAAYHPENAGCDGNFALLPMTDTADYESRSPYRSLRTRQVVPGLSEFRTSRYFRTLPDVVSPSATPPARVSERTETETRL